MVRRSLAVLGTVVLAGALAACSDAASPTSPRPLAAAPRLQGGTTDSSLTSGSGGGGGSASACGTLSSIQSYNIVVYTTRTGIGFTGNATNCGTRREAFEVDAVDQDPDPSCTVDMPHFIAQKNTDPGVTITWQANSTLVPCQGKLHTFVLTLWDTKTATVLATTTASAFL